MANDRQILRSMVSSDSGMVFIEGYIQAIMQTILDTLMPSHRMSESVKCFANNVNAYDLIAFIRDFRVVRQSDGTYINISRNRRVNHIFKKATGLANLDALFLSNSEVDDFFRIPLPF